VPCWNTIKDTSQSWPISCRDKRPFCRQYRMICFTSSFIRQIGNYIILQQISIVCCCNWWALTFSHRGQSSTVMMRVRSRPSNPRMRLDPSGGSGMPCLSCIHSSSGVMMSAPFCRSAGATTDTHGCLV